MTQDSSVTAVKYGQGGIKMNLEFLGWNSFFAKHFAPYSQPEYQGGRVAAEYKHVYLIYTEKGEILAEVSGKFRYQAKGRQDFPTVGDWVVISSGLERERAIIHAILPRQSKISRKVAGKVTEEQLIAANMDTVFLVNALNNDFNLRRMERYLTLVWESGASPVIILSKADLCANIEEKLRQVESIAYGVPIYVLSSLREEGLDSLKPYLSEGKTAVLLGSSGAGKSTLINKLAGEQIQKVQEIREKDHHGRHTTTYRELIILPQRGLIIDTPGMRELQLWDSGEGLGETFEDIEFYASHCRFNDCQHQTEPGCAVRKAIEEGNLDYARYESYLKLQKELAYLSRKTNQQEYLAEKEKWKKIHQQLKKNKY